jgi:hypothetical protein
VHATETLRRHCLDSSGSTAVHLHLATVAKRFSWILLRQGATNLSTLVYATIRKTAHERRACKMDTSAFASLTTGWVAMIIDTLWSNAFARMKSAFWWHLLFGYGFGVNGHIYFCTRGKRILTALDSEISATRSFALSPAHGLDRTVIWSKDT